MFSFEGKKKLKLHQLIVVIFIVLKTNKKMCAIFLMSTEEQLVNCVPHGFIQAFFI